MKLSNTILASLVSSVATSAAINSTNITDTTFVSQYQTTVLTVTSCANNACSEQVKTTGYYLQTITQTGVVTHTTVYCPLTALTAAPAAPASPAAPTGYGNFTTPAANAPQSPSVATTQALPPEASAPSLSHGSTLAASAKSSHISHVSHESHAAHASSSASKNASVTAFNNGVKNNLNAISGAAIGFAALFLM